MVAQQDRSLERFVSRLIVPGRLKPVPRVTGAFICVRLSKRKEKPSSLKMQERHAREYVEGVLHIPVLGVFEDIKSGLLKRRGYADMMERARLSLCSHIVVYDYDRFGRERVTSLKDFDDLEALGIEMHDPLAGLITHEVAGQKAVQANEEVRKTSRRTLDNMLERAMNEEDYNSPRRWPIGYRRTLEPGKPEKDPVLAPLITKLFERYDKGETEGSLRQWWNAQTGQTKRVSGITQILRNEYYAGIDIFNKRSASKVHGHYTKDRTEWVSRRHDLFLIDLPTFERVQARLARNAGRGQRRAARPRYPLTGLVLCAQCNTRCRGLTDGSRRYVSVQCPVCFCSRSYHRVEHVVQEALQRVPLGPGAAASGTDERVDTVGHVGAITARIEKVRERRAGLIIRREEGEIEEADYRVAMARTDRELAELADERERVVQGAQEALSVKATVEWLQTLSNWTDIIAPEKTTAAERNAVYRECFKESTLDFDQNTLTLHWMPGLARLLGRASDTLAL